MKTQDKHRCRPVGTDFTSLGVQVQKQIVVSEALWGKFSMKEGVTARLTILTWGLELVPVLIISWDSGFSRCQDPAKWEVVW